MIPDRTSGKTPGGATVSLCPRRGSIKLTAPDGRSCVIQTNCKTWSCLSCRDRLLNSFKMRVELSCLTWVRSSLITITYKADALSLSTVASVLTKDLRELWRRWKCMYPPLQWIRVTELTKVGMPHHHLVAGPIPEPQRINCYGTSFAVVRFLSRMAHCTCLSHALSRLWWDITGESFIVHATPVISARGAAAYVSKYIAKTMYNRQAFLDLGISRRWSSSRGYPGAGRLRLAQTDRGGWVSHEYQHGPLILAWTDPEWLDTPLLERNGNDLRLRLTAKNTLKSTVNKLKGMVSVYAD